MTTTDSLTTLELDRVLALVAMEAKSAPGKAAILARRPLPTLEACESAQADLFEAVRFIQTEGYFPLAGLDDLEPLFDRETVLEIEESWHAVRAIRATQAMRETVLRTNGFPRLAKIVDAIPDLGELVSRLNRYFTKEGKLREEASAELRAIRSRIHAKRGAIQRTLSDIMNRNADAVQEQLVVMRGDRYCVPIRNDHRNAVPGILHERSGSGASFFIEPMQAIELNNDLADLLIQEREEIARITRLVSATLFERRGDILSAVAVAAQVDALQAAAIFQDTIHGTRPLFTAERRLEILDGRHPLLDERLATARREALGEDDEDRTVIPLTIALGAQPGSPAGPSALVISGPNAGGKTVALKTAGLLVAMAMSGLPVPASDGTTIPCVDALHVLIGDDQSVLEHLSTFSAYLLRLKRILARTTSRSLVLLDELGSGTDPEEGAALASSVIEHLIGLDALVVVTTHLSALKSFAVNDERIVNASMEFDAATGKPTYRMITGIPGRSRAIEVAAMIGLPAPIIESARERLGERYVETDHLLATLQNKMRELTAAEERLESLRHGLEGERAAAREQAARLEAERLRLGTTYREELERLRDDVSRQLASEIKAIRESDRAARATLNANDVIRTVVRSVDKAMEFIPAEQREVHVGDKAEHRKFKVTGEVLSITGEKAVLSVSGRKMTVETRDLVPKGSASGDAKPARPHQRGGDGGDVAVVSAELNLIGQRVDEAIDECDRFLDRSLLEGRQAVRIIHGFGTGALRKGIRDYLRTHRGVKSWRPGEENEGGDGATIAVLDT